MERERVRCKVKKQNEKEIGEKNTFFLHMEFIYFLKLRVNL